MTLLRKDERKWRMMEPLKADLTLAMMEQIQKSGSALSMIKELLDDEIFGTLSKHNEFWHESEKLEDLRMKFGYIEDKLLQVTKCLLIDPYEGSL